MEIFLELAKTWGPPGLLAIVLWWQLEKAEKRETAAIVIFAAREAVKDARIQLLENKIIESYDERISAADQVTTALLTSAAKSGELALLVKQLLELTQKHRR